jgi:hypothetical protein
MDDQNNQNQPNENNDYQDILNQYAASVKPEPEVTPEPVKETADPQQFLKEVNPPQLEPEVTPPTPTLSIPTPPSEPKTTEEIKAEVDKILAPDQPQNPTTVPPVKSGPNLFKTFFILSLFLFLGVCGFLVYSLFFKSNSSITNNNPSVTPTATPTISGVFCDLNDKRYSQGESFPSADGCNTCSCESQDVIVCTEKACAITPATATPTATKSATTSSIPKDWKIYTDSTYKYSINYPSTWVKDTKLANSTIFLINSPEKIESLKDPNKYEGYSGDDINIQFYKDYKKTLTENKTIEEYFKSSGLFSNIRKIKINNIDSYLVDEAGMSTSPAYFIIKSNDVFKITSFLNFSQTELQILNTFKFN